MTAQADESQPLPWPEQRSEKPGLSDEPRPLPGESGQEPAQFARVTSAEPARLHSVASEPTSSDSGKSERGGASSADIRIFIHHAGSDVASSALAHRLAGYLRRLGYSVADIRTVDFRIENPSVRCFFGADRNGSEHLVDAVERFFDNAQSRSPQRATDFTHYTPRPRPGNVEVWLPTS